MSNGLAVEDRVWIPIDTPSYVDAELLVSSLTKAGARNFKVGLEFITSVGAKAAVELIHNYGGRVFYDGKFCDIPNTVAGASKAVAGLQVHYFNVHAWSGKKAISEAVANAGNSKVLVVTVLTSMDNKALFELGFTEMFGVGADEQGKPQGYSMSPERARLLVRSMALVAKMAGAHGVICSPQELAILGQTDGLDSSFVKITPGVRPTWASTDDQKRVMTPSEAIKAGATALVIGRPITNPPAEIGSPADALKRVYDEIASAL